MQEIAAEHVIYRPGDKYRNNQLKKKKQKGTCGCLWERKKLVVMEKNCYFQSKPCRTLQFFKLCAFFFF